jgi:hypothetical protein
LATDRTRTPIVPCSFLGCSAETELGSTFLVELEPRVSGGTIGIGCVTRDYSMFNGKEVFVEPAQALQTATVVVDDIADLGHLIVRNADIADTAAQIEALRTTPSSRNLPYQHTGWVRRDGVRHRGPSDRVLDVGCGPADG